MDKLVAMETLVRVVQAGSFSAAARQDGRSKARVSQIIAALEKDLGVALLRRTTRSLRLTEAGRRYHERCLGVLAEIDALEASVKNQRRVLEGSIRVSAPPGLASQHLDIMTSEFLARHPGVVIDLDLTHRLVDLAAEGIDVALRVTEPRDSSLIARKLAPSPIIAVASPAYLAHRGEPLTPLELKDHECIVDTNFREQQRWRFLGHRGVLTVSVSGPLRVNSPTAVRDLAIAGHGIALVPRFVASAALETGRLVEVLAGTVAFSWSVFAIYPRREYLPARVRAYLEHLQARLGEALAGDDGHR